MSECEDHDVSVGRAVQCCASWLIELSWFGFGLSEMKSERLSVLSYLSSYL